MNFLQKTNPEWPLRLGLGLMYVYSGFNLLLYPAGWLWTIPGWFGKIVTTLLPLESYIRFQGVAEVALALVLLSWFLPKKIVRVVAVVSSLEFLFILLFSPQFSITFRDIGLLGTALTLLVIYSEKDKLVKSDFTRQ